MTTAKKKKVMKLKNSIIRVRVNDEEKVKFTEDADSRGFDDLSSYILYLLRNAKK